LRHLKDIFDEAGITVTPANRKQVDQAVHQTVGVTYKDCPTTWKNLKKEILNNPEKRQAFIRQLQVTLR
jgi:hypothetical protein